MIQNKEYKARYGMTPITNIIMTLSMQYLTHSIKCIKILSPNLIFKS